MNRGKIICAVSLILGCALFALSGCSNFQYKGNEGDKTAGTLPFIDEKPWGENQTATYTIYNKNEEYGTAEITTIKNSDNKTYDIQKTKSIKADDKAEEVKSGVTVNADTLMPTSSYYNKTSVSENFEISTQYSDDWNVDTTVNNTTNQKLNLPNSYYDNESLAVILGAVSYDDKATFRINDTIPLIAGISVLDIKYKGTETISVPYGEAECYKVFLGKIVFWFSVANRTLYQYQDGDIIYNLTAYKNS